MQLHTGAVHTPQESPLKASWEKKALAALGVKPASASCQTRHSTNWATSPPRLCYKSPLADPASLCYARSCLPVLHQILLPCPTCVTSLLYQILPPCVIPDPGSLPSLCHKSVWPDPASLPSLCHKSVWPDPASLPSLCHKSVWPDPASLPSLCHKSDQILAPCPACVTNLSDLILAPCPKPVSQICLTWSWLPALSLCHKSVWPDPGSLPCLCYKSTLPNPAFTAEQMEQLRGQSGWKVLSPTLTTQLTSQVQVWFDPGWGLHCLPVC